MAARYISMGTWFRKMVCGSAESGHRRRSVATGFDPKASHRGIALPTVLGAGMGLIRTRASASALGREKLHVLMGPWSDNRIAHLRRRHRALNSCSGNPVDLAHRLGGSWGVIGADGLAPSASTPRYQGEAPRSPVTGLYPRVKAILSREGGI